MSTSRCHYHLGFHLWGTPGGVEACALRLLECPEGIWRPGPAAILAPALGDTAQAAPATHPWPGVGLAWSARARYAPPPRTVEDDMARVERALHRAVFETDEPVVGVAVAWPLPAAPGQAVAGVRGLVHFSHMPAMPLLDIIGPRLQQWMESAPSPGFCRHPRLLESLAMGYIMGRRPMPALVDEVRAAVAGACLDRNLPGTTPTSPSVRM